MLPEGTPGKYILVALFNGRLVKSDCCPTREEVAALTAKWEIEGWTVAVEENKSEKAIQSALR